jgi:hypothetical protein
MLMMRFRKKSLARFNLLVTNRITGLFAGWLPGFGIIRHVGRKPQLIARKASFWTGCVAGNILCRSDASSIPATIQAACGPG